MVAVVAGSLVSCAGMLIAISALFFRDLAASVVFANFGLALFVAGVVLLSAGLVLLRLDRFAFLTVRPSAPNQEAASAAPAYIPPRRVDGVVGRIMLFVIGALVAGTVAVFIWRPAWFLGP